MGQKKKIQIKSSFNLQCDRVHTILWAEVHVFVLMFTFDPVSLV